MKSALELLKAYDASGLSNYSSMHIKYLGKRFRVCEDMRKGYESMADINLSISEFGLFDYLSTLSDCEAIWNGDDN